MTVVVWDQWRMSGSDTRQWAEALVALARETVFWGQSFGWSLRWIWPRRVRRSAVVRAEDLRGANGSRTRWRVKAVEVLEGLMPQAVFRDQNFRQSLGWMWPRRV